MYLVCLLTFLTLALDKVGLLSLIMSVFDSLGMVSLFLLPLKLLLQRLTKSGLGWDSEIPGDEKLVWDRFLRALPMLFPFLAFLRV